MSKTIPIVILVVAALFTNIASAEEKKRITVSENPRVVLECGNAAAGERHMTLYLRQPNAKEVIARLGQVSLIDDIESIRATFIGIETIHKTSDYEISLRRADQYTCEEIAVALSKSIFAPR